MHWADVFDCSARLGNRVWMTNLERIPRSKCAVILHISLIDDDVFVFATVQDEEYVGVL